MFEPFPTFSVTERDRRWAETRARMAAESIDALVLPPGLAAVGGAGNASHRYLSQVGWNHVPMALVFPVTGEPTLFLPDDEDPRAWQKLSWVEDVRAGPLERFGDAVASRLRELRLETATIGIPALAESIHASGVLHTIQEKFPQAFLVDTSPLLADQHAVKSAEEIKMLERACAVAERGLLMLTYRVHAGMLQTEAFGILQGAMFEAGCDPGSNIRWGCSKQPGATWWAAPRTPIDRGDIIQPEIQTRVAGYAVHETHPISIGKPRGAVQEMFDLAVQTFKDALPLMKAGEAANMVADQAAHGAQETPFRTLLSSYAIGLTLDVLLPAATYREGQALAIKVSVSDSDESTIAFGSTVVVTPEGGRRLSQRHMTLLGSHRSFLAPYLNEPRELPSPWSPFPARAATERPRQARSGGQA
jgi:Xaa-Pro aminopeptidase